MKQRARELVERLDARSRLPDRLEHVSSIESRIVGGRRIRAHIVVERDDD